MTEEELLKTQNELLRVVVRLMLDEQVEGTEKKSKFLADYEFTHQEIAEILGKSRPTISKHVGGDD